MIDTLKWAKRLIEAGFTEQQAYGYVDATVDALQQAGYGLTTEELRMATEIKAAIEPIDARLKTLEEAWHRLSEGCREMAEEDRRRQP